MGKHFLFAAIAHLAILLTFFPVANAWYIYAEWDYDLASDLPNFGEQSFGFYEGKTDCNGKGKVGFFLAVEDVNELPNASGVNCDGCSAGVGDPPETITRLEWFDKSSPTTWGHHTFYLDRGGIFVDTNNNRKGVCVQEPKGQEHSLNCQSNPPNNNHRATSQLSCVWDPPTQQPDPPEDPPEEPPKDQPPKDEVIKMMIAGDSISHGMEGDWTWRYRLWKWLKNAGYQVEFVGPFKGTHGKPNAFDIRPQPSTLPGESPSKTIESEGKYAPGVDSEFLSSGHASFWGRQAKQTRETIKEWVSTYQPDYLLLLVGFNDLGWFVTDADGLMDNMGHLVENARQAKSDLKFLIGNVVDRTFINGRQDLVDETNKYNKLLRGKLEPSEGEPEDSNSWFRFGSPLVHVDMNTYYNCAPSSCPDGWDGLHPNAKGEIAIANGFAQRLWSDYKFQASLSDFPKDIPPRSIGTPSSVRAVATDEGIVASWNGDPNARGYRVRSRLEGQSSWWSDSKLGNGESSYITWLLADQTWEVQVATLGDNDAVSAWSSIASATAHPKTAPGPPNIITQPAPSNAIKVTWSPSNVAVNRYVVIFWDLDTPDAWITMYATTDTQYSEFNLLYGHRYGVWVSTWINLLAGPAGGIPTSAREVLIGGGSPAPLSKVTATNTAPTTVDLSWSAQANAAGYAIYYKSLVDWNGPQAFVRYTSTVATTIEVAYLFPGTWNYQFCVMTYNGNLESGWTCVTPGKWPGFRSTLLSNETAAANGTVPELPMSNSTTQEGGSDLRTLITNFFEAENKIPMDNDTVSISG